MSCVLLHPACAPSAPEFALRSVRSRSSISPRVGGGERVERRESPERVSGLSPECVSDRQTVTNHWIVSHADFAVRHPLVMKAFEVQSVG